MKIRVLSDLHLETAPFTYERKGEDVLVLAGDILSRSRSAFMRSHRFWDSIKESRVSAFYVAGNHEFYEGNMTRGGWREFVKHSVPSNVIPLDSNSVCIGDVRFLGCTLWTDFSLVEGLSIAGKPLTRDVAMQLAYAGISDFQQIWQDRPLGLTQPLLINPHVMTGWYNEEHAWLKRNIEKQPARSVWSGREARRSQLPRTVVITHFVPSPQSIHPMYENNVLNPYFVTDCRELMTPSVDLWIHGHTHSSFDYMEGQTRVVCNPRGYGDENSQFNPDLIVEI